MGLIVQKYGGSSVADAGCIMNVAKKIIRAYSKGNKVVVVLSAQGDTTDELIAKAMEISDRPSKRELDMLMSTGEQISIALMAMALEKLGYKAVSLIAGQAGIYTNAVHGSALIKRICADRIFKELDEGKIVIVAGFQGIDDHGDITTLGRGGSDTTAVALAAALNADHCEIYTDVDGVYTADPRIVRNARKLDEVTYDEMLELASLGARVLHNRSVELANNYRVKLVVRSSKNNHKGTLVREAGGMEKTVVKGVTYDTDIARLSVIAVRDIPGVAYKLFKLLADANINVDIILQSIGRDDTKDISFTVSRSQLSESVEVINRNLDYLGAKAVSFTRDIAKVSIVGAGMAAHPGVAATMFGALADEGINIHMISTSEIKISCLISADEVDKAVKAIHDRFNLGEAAS
ncbi:MAG TPA: aspartate kinase [Candidatus Atribacteria bacterium]|nr:aspartate kinase [Candidatus Atribacteria bacterium]HPT78884.1 aspartate kinase [Candidatus Atribacteria bacterium]